MKCVVIHKKGVYLIHGWFTHRFGVGVRCFSIGLNKRGAVFCDVAFYDFNCFVIIINDFVETTLDKEVFVSYTN